MVALFNGVGGGAVALISFVEYREALEITGGNPELEALIPILFAAIIGSVSFWGSNIAFGKLQELHARASDPAPWAADRQRRCCCSWRSAAAVAIAAGAESRGPVHRSSWWPRRCSATWSCCRSAERTCRW